MVQDLVFNGTNWQGVVGGIPAGNNLTFTANAYDSLGNIIYTGQATGIQITGGGAAIAVAMTLQQVAAPVPLTIEAPIIDAMTASAAIVAPSKKCDRPRPKRGRYHYVSLDSNRRKFQ